MIETGTGIGRRGICSLLVSCSPSSLPEECLYLACSRRTAYEKLCQHSVACWSALLPLFSSSEVVGCEFWRKKWRVVKSMCPLADGYRNHVHFSSGGRKSTISVSLCWVLVRALFLVYRWLSSWSVLMRHLWKVSCFLHCWGISHMLFYGCTGRVAVMSIPLSYQLWFSCVHVCKSSSLTQPWFHIHCTDSSMKLLWQYCLMTLPGSVCQREFWPKREFLWVWFLVDKHQHHLVIISWPGSLTLRTTDSK